MIRGMAMIYTTNAGMCRAGLLLLISILLCFCAESNAKSQDSRPVLVIFHGVMESSNDMIGISKSALNTQIFSEVAVMNYDWRNGLISDIAPRLFNSLNSKFPNSRFVLYGFDKGGLIAEWIATRVKEAESRVIRVVTVDAPLDGFSNLNANPAFPSLKEFASDSSTILALKNSPLNNINNVDFVRVWEKDSKIAGQNSALRSPVAQAAASRRVIVRTKPFDPREVFPEILAKAQKDLNEKLYSQVIQGCEYITKIEPKHAYANELLGFSNLNLADGESNSAKSAEFLALGYRQLATAMEGGEGSGGYFFPVIHHHSMGDTPGVMTFGGL